MIDYDYDREDEDDALVVLSDKRVWAAKAHVCSACGKAILPGTEYRKTAIINENGAFEELKTHIPKWVGNWNGGGRWTHLGCGG